MQLLFLLYSELGPFHFWPVCSLMLIFVFLQFVYIRSHYIIGSSAALAKDFFFHKKQLCIISQAEFMLIIK